MKLYTIMLPHYVSRTVVALQWAALLPCPCLLSACRCRLGGSGHS